MNNGGTFTAVNSGPINRDSLGRIYQERWLMSPKGSNIPSRMSGSRLQTPWRTPFISATLRKRSASC
jgi:hypothetical protein